MKKKKILISVASVSAVLLIALAVTLAVIFTPRKLSNLVSLDNIESVSLKAVGVNEEIEKTLSEEQTQEFIADVKAYRYKLVFYDIKTRGECQFTIVYKSGEKTVCTDYRIFLYKSDGSLKKRVRIIGSEFFDYQKYL